MGEQHGGSFPICTKGGVLVDGQSRQLTAPGNAGGDSGISHPCVDDYRSAPCVRSRPWAAPTVFSRRARAMQESSPCPTGFRNTPSQVRDSRDMISSANIICAGSLPESAANFTCDRASARLTSSRFSQRPPGCRAANLSGMDRQLLISLYAVIAARRSPANARSRTA